MPVRGPRPCPSGRAGRAGRAQCTQGWWEGPPTDQLSSIPPQALSQCSDAAGKRMGCLLNCLAETRGLSCGGPQLGMLAHRQQYPGCLTWFNSGSSQTEQPQCPRPALLQLKTTGHSHQAKEEVSGPLSDTSEFAGPLLSPVCPGQGAAEATSPEQLPAQEKTPAPEESPARGQAARG